jgi:hypothetical protein
MRSPWLKWAGIVAIGLVVLGLAVRAVIAIGKSQPFTGSNYWGAPIGAFLVLAVVAVGAVCGLWWIVHRFRR